MMAGKMMIVAALGIVLGLGVAEVKANFVSNSSFESPDTNGASWWLPATPYNADKPMMDNWITLESYAVGVWGYGTVEGLTANNGDQVAYLAKNSYLQNTGSPISSDTIYRLSSYAVSDYVEADVVELKIMTKVPNPLAPTDSQYDIYYTLASKTFTPNTVAQGWSNAPLALDFSVTDQSRYVTVTYGGNTLENVDIVGRPLVVTLEGFDRNNYCYFDDVQLNMVPEPVSLVMLALGGVLGLIRRK